MYLLILILTKYQVVNSAFYLSKSITYSIYKKAYLLVYLYAVVIINSKQYLNNVNIV